MPAGQALFQMCGVFAEFERSMIQDRVKASINRVRAKGEPWGRRKIEETDPAVCTQNLELRREGLGMVTIGKRVGLSSRTVWRFLRRGRRRNSGCLTLKCKQKRLRAIYALRPQGLLSGGMIRLRISEQSR